ncbi:MAG: hypothetical protein M3A24_01360 [Candidatus Rhabdochlamydia oedothoracis]|nr:hypothetical protein [Candidatus Rhabdochlamydia oedothoracis]
MSTQPINHLPIETHIKPVTLSKLEWVDRQISTFGKRAYSQLIKITHLFYQTVKTHPKKTLAILAGTTATLVIYYKGKTLVTSLKSFNKKHKEKTFQQKINILSKNFFEELTKIEKNIQDISRIQKTIHDFINAEQLQITNQHRFILNDLKKLPEEKIALLETNIKSLVAYKQKITKLITETNKYKTHFVSIFQSI